MFSTIYLTGENYPINLPSVHLYTISLYIDLKKVIVDQLISYFQRQYLMHSVHTHTVRRVS